MLVGGRTLVTPPTLPQTTGIVTVGVDTHRDLHVAAALDGRGGLIATESFPTTAQGHRLLEGWAVSFGETGIFGVEGTSAYGAGLTRHLLAQGHRVVEVDRPNRQIRHRRGKSDAIDAEAAARAVLAGTATGAPKHTGGAVEAIRVLRVARRSAVKARSEAIVQLRALIITAPDDVRASLQGLGIRALVATCARLRPGAPTTARDATRWALKSLAQRCHLLDTEIETLNAQLEPLVRSTCPELLAVHGVGVEGAGQLLVTAGDNRERLRSEACFAKLCGVAPIPASSGQTHRFRLNRGGDRQANAALYRIVLVRMRWDPRTIAYVQRRTTDGRTKREIIRCLKRYVAREVFPLLQNCCA
jgi:transposase